MSVSQLLDSGHTQEEFNEQRIKFKTQPDIREGFDQEYIDFNQENKSSKKKQKSQRKYTIKTHCYKTQQNQQNIEKSSKNQPKSSIKNSPLKQQNQNCQENTVEISKKIKLKKLQCRHSQISLVQSQNKSSQRSKKLGKDHIEPRKISTAFSRHKKDSCLNSGKKSVNRSCSRSKVRFEIIHTHERTSSKLNVQENPQQIQFPAPIFKKIQEQNYKIPYPCPRNIVIDLFQPSRKSSLSRSRSKDVSKKSHSNSQSKSCFHKSLTKSQYQIENEEKIKSTMQKLEQFQLVSDYKNKLEIQNILKSYILSGEPQCKWVLLVVDRIFQKLRAE